MPKIIQNVKESLIAEGRKTLLKKSYKELNIRDIVKNCGIGIGTFYNYFSNKDDLMTSIFIDDWNKTLMLIEELKYTDTPLKQKLYSIFISLQTFLDSYISVFYEIALEKGHESNHYNYFKLYTVMEELLEIEKQNGNINSTLDVKKLSRFIVSNLVYLCKSKYMSFDELFNNIIV